MIKSRIKIACCSTLNDLYFEGFVTFFYSLLHHNPSFNLPYYIFTWGELSEHNIKKLEAIYDKFVIKKIDNNKYNGVEYSDKWRTWNINCINRFEIFTLEEYDRLIFLDADMLVLGDLSELFKYDVDFGACTITENSEMDHPSRYDKTLKSFDGGLMIIGKKYLCKTTIESLIEIAKQKKWTSDEPILNVFFDNTKTTYLPKEYNTLTTEITPDNLKSCKILQFVGVKKPWLGKAIHEKYDDFNLQKMNSQPLVLKVDMLYQSYYKKAMVAYDLK